jgi:hypothetical protein
MLYSDWTCTVCGLGDPNHKSPSRTHPTVCTDCAGETCSRCGNWFDGDDDKDPDYPGLCSWCGDQWDDTLRE